MTAQRGPYLSSFRPASASSIRSSGGRACTRTSSTHCPLRLPGAAAVEAAAEEGAEEEEEPGLAILLKQRARAEPPAGGAAAGAEAAAPCCTGGANTSQVVLPQDAFAQTFW